MASKVASILIPILLSALLLHTTQAHNITAILDGFPDYALYNSYLSKTKVCDEINAHETVTCLVLSDAAMSSLVTAAKQSLAGIKNALRLLSLLDYFDPPKLHDLPSGTTLTTTLYQTTGNAAGNLGFVNITNLRGGKVGFAAAAPGSKFDASYVKSVREMPFNLSIIEISDAVIFPGLFDATASTANITALLEKAGCKTFASLIASSGVLKIYQTQMDKGLTLFAPNDDAFQAPGAPDLSSLSSADLVTLLQYHALPQYTPKSSLSAESGPIQTLASSAAGKYEISVAGNGDDVSLDTGVGKSRVASTVLDDTPNTIMTVDSLLLPVELFGGAPTPAPAPGPAALVPVPAPAALAPAPATKKHRLHHSPPAPPMEAPAEAPAKTAADKADVKAAAAVAGPMGLLAAISSSLVFVNLLM
ncbi:fasciclin-like arabinogalactan protein 8 [Carex littledalei]|uniref:Fasciclin-like arabinogalactan protein 8 n=1 Tax=Carex littledalei TaxID=544730 RepID=A0A833VDC4_9POAL|nr:fasciclin-like arabinogalactan protein 8 [Carex littledalei]